MKGVERLEQVRAILARHKAELMAMPGVTGVGIGAGEQEEPYSIVVYVRAHGAIPAGPNSIEDVPVRYVVTGTIEIQTASPTRP